MIILRKNKILFIITCITTSIAFFSLNSNTKTIPTSSTPVTNHTVILDAGHGLPDGGAENSDGTFESNINLEIVKKLQNLLELSNCSVILTRADKNGIYDLDSNSIREKKVSDMENRVKIGNNSNAEIFISIHLNKINSSKYSGWQTFYQLNSKNSLKLASSIQENLNNSIQKENKRKPSKLPDIYLAQNLNLPFVIVECGFLSNPEECNLLKKDKYQEKLAWGIYTGIMDYYN